VLLLLLKVVKVDDDVVPRLQPLLFVVFVLLPELLLLNDELRDSVDDEFRVLLLLLPTVKERSLHVELLALQLDAAGDRNLMALLRREKLLVLVPADDLDELSVKSKSNESWSAIVFFFSLSVERVERLLSCVRFLCLLQPLSFCAYYFEHFYLLALTRVVVVNSSCFSRNYNRKRNGAARSEQREK
jgi:hypothetical protein